MPALRHDRPRQHARRGAFLQLRAEHGGQADSGIRGVCGARNGHAARPHTRAGRRKRHLSPDAAGPRLRGLSEPVPSEFSAWLHRRATTTSRASTTSCFRSIPEGVIAFSGCLGSEVQQLLMGGREKEARERLLWYRDLIWRELLHRDSGSWAVRAEEK